MFCYVDGYFLFTEQTAGKVWASSEVCKCEQLKEVPVHQVACDTSRHCSVSCFGHLQTLPETNFWNSPVLLSEPWLGSKAESM